MTTNETTTPEFKQTSTEHPVLARIGWVLLAIAIKFLIRGMFAN